MNYEYYQGSGHDIRINETNYTTYFNREIILKAGQPNGELKRLLYQANRFKDKK